MEALKGVKIVEFAAFAAGPAVGKHLADHGATVVHVESRVRPDGFRTHYPPYKDNIHGLNRSGLFALCNNDKLDVTLNLKKTPAATELAKRMAAWADVVIENFSPGTMSRLGIDYDVLKQVKPDLVMLSTSNLGQTGPHAHHAGFGSQLSSLAGFTHLTGYPGGSPQILYGPYIDYIAVAYGAVAILAALDYRWRTGKGNHIDMAQYETGLQYLAPILLDYKVNGRVADRNANRDTHASPHGAYPCKGDDSWCALSIHSDAEWKTFCDVAGKPEWSADEKFATRASRKANEDELDRAIAAWTSRHTARELMEKLQAAGLRAGVVNTMKDVYTDPQLASRPQWIELEHPEIGKMHYQRPPFLLSKTPPGPAKRDPLLAEHNDFFYKELLGLSEEEYRKLVEEQVIF
ncbi:MAG TPA: CoA transferase [Candidatus Binatia bacterium]|jgi:crotonobetainyl-CoA:carnitine CoA-transferase CaiB-like acyl-CoA transferase